MIVATNQDLKAAVKAETFRKDLYYRINVFPIEIPPLRERRGDIAVLADRFVKKYNEEYGRQIWMIAEPVLQRLASYDFPGNVRELENIIMSAVSMAEDDHVLTEKDINISTDYHQETENIGGYTGAEGSLAEYLAGIEEKVIRHYLALNGGNITRTAKDLGMLRQNLQHKLRKYGLG